MPRAPPSASRAALLATLDDMVEHTIARLLDHEPDDALGVLENVEVGYYHDYEHRKATPK